MERIVGAASGVGDACKADHGALSLDVLRELHCLQHVVCRGLDVHNGDVKVFTEQVRRASSREYEVIGLDQLFNGSGESFFEVAHHNGHAYVVIRACLALKNCGESLIGGNGENTYEVLHAILC